MSETANTPNSSEQIPQPEEFDAIGKTWKIGPPNYNSRTFIEVQFAAHARRNMDALFKASPQEFATEKAALSRAIARGDYKTLNPGWLEMLPTKEGADIVIWSWLRVNHPDVTIADVVRIQEEAQEPLRQAIEGIQDRFFWDVVQILPKTKQKMAYEAILKAWKESKG